MPDGNVGGGSQNRYNPIGEILYNNGRAVLRYRKGRRLQAINRLDPPCWNAGTPVYWDDGIKKDPDGIANGKDIKPTTEVVQGTKDPMLATRINNEGKPEEYHPLIQFFNEVMAGIVRDRMTIDLDNLKGPTSAARLWKYFEKKYLTGAMTMEDSAEFSKFLKELHEGQDKDGLVDEFQ